MIQNRIKVMSAIRRYQNSKQEVINAEANLYEILESEGISTTKVVPQIKILPFLTLRELKDFVERIEQLPEQEHWTTEVAKNLTDKLLSHKAGETINYGEDN